VAQSTAFNAHRATARRLRGRLAPQVLKAARRKFGIAHRRLDTSMTKVRLQRARIGALVRQDKAGGMAQHVWMHLEADLGLDAGALDQLGQTSDGPVPPLARRMWRVALSNSTSDHCNSQSSLARNPCRKPIRIIVLSLAP